MSSFNAGSADAHADANSPRAVNDEAERTGPSSALQEARVSAGAPQRLTVSCEAFQSYYDNHKAYLDSFEAKREKRNLVIRLPDELLSAIFLAVPNAVGHAFTLAGTCKWWRAVALSMPHLWARVSCVWEGTADAAAQGLWAEYLRTSLHRMSTRR